MLEWQKRYLTSERSEWFCQGEHKIPLLDGRDCFAGTYTIVKFIRNYIRDRSGIFSVSLLTRISMTSFRPLGGCQTFPNAVWKVESNGAMEQRRSTHLSGHKMVYWEAEKCKHEEGSFKWLTFLKTTQSLLQRKIERCSGNASSRAAGSAHTVCLVCAFEFDSPL